MMHKRVAMGAAVLVSLLSFAGPSVALLLAQESLGGTTNSGGVQLNFGSHYGPATAASLQIQAEAAYARAYGELQKDLALARIRHAQARALEGRNSVQAVRDHIAKQRLLEEERDRRIGTQLAKQHKTHAKILERLKNHPELNGGEVETGVALNFLKNRLATKIINFRAESMGAQDAVREVSRQLKVTPDIVHSLRVREKVRRGDAFVFRLDEAQGLQVDKWPPVLRAPELRPARKRFMDAREAVFAPGNQNESEEQQYDKLRNLIVALNDLELAFLQSDGSKTRTKSGHTWAAYLDGKAFLQTLGSEIRRMEKVGAAGPSQSLAFRGDYFPDLLAHLVSNGLEFAPVIPGEERAYHVVFEMMRDLWLAVEFDGDIPEASTDAVIPPTPERAPLPGS
ncbi:MAG: hypothetical protein JSS02_17320 [Planctomycetes bacterium]|nr:hypothetical protein [Planctomycetota bacterium]